MVIFTIMKQLFFYSLIALFLWSCATQKTFSELGHIVFTDTDVFDNNLSESMSVNSDTITVTMLAPVSINQMPNRLNKWLSAVNSRGGQVEFYPKIESKSPIWLLGFLPMAYRFLRNELLYGSASDYNAKIFYKPESGTVEKVVFVKK